MKTHQAFRLVCVGYPGPHTLKKVALSPKPAVANLFGIRPSFGEDSFSKDGGGGMVLRRRCE